MIVNNATCLWNIFIKTLNLLSMYMCDLVHIQLTFKQCRSLSAFIVGPPNPQFFCIHGCNQPWTKQYCSIYSWTISAYKWTWAVQTHVVQRVNCPKTYNHSSQHTYVFCWCLNAILCSHLIKLSTIDQPDLQPFTLLAQYSENTLRNWMHYCPILSWIYVLCVCVCVVCFCHSFCVWGNSLVDDQLISWWSSNSSELNTKNQRNGTMLDIKTEVLCLKMPSRKWLRVKTALRLGWSPLTLTLWETIGRWMSWLRDF